MRKVSALCIAFFISMLCNVKAQSIGGIITTIAGTGTYGFAGDGGPATAAQIDATGNLAIDLAGNIYFSDGYNHRIRKITPSGFISTIAGTGMAGFSGDGGPATAAQLDFPQGVANDDIGNIYISDASNNRIRKVDAMGTIFTIAGTGFAGNTGDGGPATNATLNNPAGLFINGTGNLLIVDENNNSIRSVSSGGIITSIVHGTAGVRPIRCACGLSCMGDGGPAYNGLLYFPLALTVDGTGNTFICDTRDDKIRKINTSSVISTFASGCDGIFRPTDVAFDGSGNLYVASAPYYKVQKIDPLGAVTTIAGAGTSGHTGDGGDALLAQLQNPTGIKVDALGNIYINDGGAIRKISSTAANSRPVFVNGTSQTLGGCQGNFGSINTLLAVRDSNAGQTETWSVDLTPSHGTLSGFPASLVSTGSNITPSGLSYIPTPGYSGADSFAVRISDGTAFSVTTVRVTVYANPANIVGTGSVCAGDSTIYSSPSFGGTWLSNNTSVATINSSTGRLRGITAGAATITYMYPTGCYVTKTVTVMANSAGTITGASTMSVGSSITLTDAVPGGVWSSSNNSVATVGSATGIVTNLTSGIFTISYTVLTPCGINVATKTITAGTVTGNIWYSVTSGGDASVLTNWWSANNNTGTHPTTFANSSDIWVVQSNMTFSVTNFLFAGSVNIVSGGILNAPSNTLSIGGNWSNTGGIFNHNNGTVIFNGTYSGITISGILTGSSSFYHLTFNGIGGSWSFGSSAVTVIGNFNIISGTVIAPTLTLNISGNWINTGIFIEGTGGIVNVVGSWTNNGTFTNSGGTVNMIGTIGGIVISGNLTGINKFYHLSFNGSGGSWNFSNPADIGGNFTIISGTVSGPAVLNVTLNFTINGGSFTPALAGTVYVGGSWFNGGVFIHNNCTVIMNGSSSGLTISGLLTGVNKFYNLSFSHTSGSWSFGTTIVDIENNFSIIAGTVTAPSLTLQIGGNWFSNGTFVHNSGTVKMISNIAGRTFSGIMTGTSKFFNLTFNGTGSWSFGANAVDVANNFNIILGIVTAPSTTIQVGGSWINNGSFVHNGGAVVMVGNTAGITLSGTGMTGANKFYNLSFNGIGGSWSFTDLVDIGGNFSIFAGSVTVPSVFNVTGNFTINGGTLIAAYLGVINVSGTWYNGGTFTHNNCTVNMIGASSSYTITGNLTGTSKFYNLVFSGVGSSWSFGGSVDVAGNFNIVNGTVVAPTLVLNISGNWINSGTFIEGLGGTVYVTGSWTNNGIFTNNGGTVNLVGTIGGITISGNLTGVNKFYHLTFNGSGGSWTFLNPADIGGNFTIISGSVYGPAVLNVTLNFNINGGSFTPGNLGTVYVGGSWFNGGIFIHNNCTVIMNGSTTGLTLGGNMTLGTSGRFYNLVFSGSGSWTFGAYDVDVFGNFSITGTGSVTGTSANLKIFGNWTHTGTGIFIHNNGTVIFAGGPSILSGFMTTTSKFNNIIFIGGSTYTFNNDADINGNFIITSGTVNPFAGGTYHVLGSFNIASGGVFNTTLNNFLLFVGLNWSNLGTFYAGTSTVTMTGVSGGLTLSGNMTGINKFCNLVFNGIGGNWTILNNIDVNIDFTILNGTVTTIANHICNIFGSWYNSGFFIAGAASIINIGSAIGGSWDNTGGVFTANTSTVNMNGTIGGLTFAGNMTGGSKFYKLIFNGVGGSWLFTSGFNTEVADSFTITNGTVTTSAGHILSITGSWINYGTYFAGSTSTINVFTNWHNYGIFNAGTGTVNMKGVITGLSLNGNMTLATNGRFCNLTFNGIGGAWLLTSHVDVLGDFTITNGTVNTPASHILTIKGSWSNSGTFNAGALSIIHVGGNWFNGGTFAAGTSKVDMNATAAGFTLSGLMTGANKFYDLTFNGSGGWSFGTYAADVAHDFIITTGTVIAPSDILKIAANYTNNGTFTHNGGTVILNGTVTGLMLSGNMVLSGNRFNILIFDGVGGSWTFNNNVETESHFSILNGTVIAPFAGTIAVSGNWLNNGVFTHNNSTVIMAGWLAILTLNGNMTGANSFYNLHFVGAGGWTFLSPSVTLINNYLQSNGTVDAPSATFTVGGNWTHTGGIYYHNHGTVLMNGNASGIDSLSGLMTGPSSFYNLTFNSSVTGMHWYFVNAASTRRDFNIANGTVHAQANDTLKVGGNYTNNGTFTHNNSVFVMNGTTTSFTLNGAMTGTSKFHTLIFDGVGAGWSFGGSADIGKDLIINAGTVTAPSALLQIMGNWVNHGTFSHNNGMVSFLGSAIQTVTGITNFNDVITNNTAGLTINDDQTISGAMNIVNGLIRIGTNNLIFGALAPAISGLFSNTAMIVANMGGQVRKQITGNGSFTFPIGDTALNYSPITIDFTGGTYNPGAFYGVSVTNAKHPHNANTNNYLKRYWRVTTSAVTSPAYAATSATYTPSDIVGTEANISGGYYYSTLPWLKFSTVNTSTHSFVTGTVSSNVSYFTGIATQAPAVTASPNSVICAGQSSVINAFGVTADTIISYSWAPTADLHIASRTSVVVSPTVTTVYSVTITDGNGFTSSGTTTVSVNPLPAAHTVIGGGIICKGSDGVYVGLNGSDIGINYQLKTGSIALGSIVTGTGSPLDFGLHTVPGDYFTIAMNPVTNCARIMTDSVLLANDTTRYPVFSITASAGLNIAKGQSDTLKAIVTSSNDKPEYQWLLNGSYISGAITNTYFSKSFNDNDSVSCLMTNPSICGGAATKQTVVIHIKSTGVPSIADNNSELRLMPNPNSGIFTLNLVSVFNEDVHVIVTNVVGAQVMDFPAVTNMEIPVHLDAPTGIYFVSASTAHATYTAKMIIK